MTHIQRRIGFVCSIAGLLTVNAAAEPPTISLKAVQINDWVITPTNTVTAKAGDTIVAEIYASNWSPNGEQLRAWQATINMFGFLSGERGAVLPLGWDRPIEAVPCTSDEDCPENVQCHLVDGQPTYCEGAFEVVYGTCNSDEDCPEGQHCYSEPHICAGPNYEPELGAFIDTSRADYVYFDRPELNAVSWLEYMYGSVVFYLSDSPVYSPPPKYCGTLVLAVSDNACGTFTIAFQRVVVGHSGVVAVTFLRDLDLYQITPLTLKPLTIVTLPCEVEKRDPSDRVMEAR